MNTSGGAEAFMVLASNNEISFNSAINCQGPNSTLGGFEGGCYEIVNQNAGTTISNISFHHNYCEKSVGLFEASSGNYTGGDNIQVNHGIIENVSVSYNISVDSMWLFLLQPVNTDFKNIVFANNTIIHTPNSAVYWDSGGGHFSMALAVSTDSSTGTTYTADNQYYKQSGGFQPGTVIVKNNIFVDNISSTRNMMFLCNVTDHSNNIFVPSNASLSSLTLGSTEKKADLSALTFTSDYRLTSSSTPAIDQGTTMSMSTAATATYIATQFSDVFIEDIDHHTVPCGSAVDIGASEYCASAGGTSGTGGSPGAGGTAVASTGGTATSTGGTKASTGGTVATNTGGNPTMSTGGAVATGTGGTLATSTGGKASTSTGGIASNTGGTSVVPSTGGSPAAQTGGATAIASNGGSNAGAPSSAGSSAGGGSGDVGSCACRIAGAGRSGSTQTLWGLALVSLCLGTLARRRRRG
jgi:MYXO-CTERM domain-containing protein